MEGRAASVALDVVTKLSHGPAGMTVASDGSLIVSIHPSFGSRERVLKITRAGEMVPFPTGEMNFAGGAGQLTLDAVMGVQSGPNGVIWLLDSGRRGSQVPKVVGWNLHNDRLHRVVYLPPPATTETSFLVDLAVHPDGNLLIIAGPRDVIPGAELQKIEHFLARGGRMLVLFNFASVRKETGLEAVLARWGVEVGRNVVTDPDNSIKGTDVIVSRFSQHPLVNSLQHSRLHLTLPRTVGRLKLQAEAADAP